MDSRRNLINQLRAQKGRLQDAIWSLERLQAEIPGGAQLLDGRGRSGRQYMRVEERKQVSERMKRYWARKREDASH